MRRMIISIALVLTTACQFGIVEPNEPEGTTDAGYLPEDAEPEACEEPIKDIPVADNDFEVPYDDVCNNDTSWYYQQTPEILEGVTITTRFSLSTPAGNRDTEYQELLRFWITIEGATEPLEAISLAFLANLSDEAGRDWGKHLASSGFDVYNLTIDGTSRVALTGSVDPDCMREFAPAVQIETRGSTTLLNGTTFFAVYGDTWAASVLEADTLRVDFVANSLVINDGLAGVKLVHAGTLGGTLEF